MKCSFRLSITLLLILSNTLHAKPQSEQKAVLVTGASSGIGLKVTEYLVKNGFYVYAGARKDADLKRLDAMKNISSVRVDVTKPAEITAAVDFVRAQKRGLFGIVNNAGVGVFSNMSEVPDKDILWIHNVNVMGPVRVNRAFLPMLKDSKGRTAIIGSISGYVTGAQSGAYSMSKFAVEAYSESLAADLKNSSISVAQIDPGSYQSKIREKVSMFAMTGKYQLSQDLTDTQKEALEKAIARNNRLKEPDEVAEAVVDFMTSDTPRSKYMVVPTKEQAAMTIKTTLGRVVQLNADQPYEYSREQLIAILDELLAKK